MRKKLLVTLLVVTVIGLAWASALNQVLGAQPSKKSNNYESSYTFNVQNGYYLAERTLYVSITHSLRDYYVGKSHTIINEKDYAKFVTPNAVQSIAGNIRNFTRDTPYDDEEFANAVLMIVHEIPYVKSNAKYSVETLVDNQADCDGLSILAASIMKAGGLDVVLLLYNGINPTHMNVGVCLENKPVSHSWWVVPSGVEYNNKTYWIAECTSLAEWTVGDRPELLANNKPQVISLEKSEKNSPAHVSSSLDSIMQPSSISVDLSAGYSNVTSNERTINISGTVTPVFPNETVTLYINQPGYPPSPFLTSIDESGNYVLPWNVTLPGTYILKTSWSGYTDYSGSDSDAVTVFIGAQQPTITELPSNFWDSGSSPVQSPTYSAGFASLFNQGVKEFLKRNLTGTDVVLSGDFIVLSDGREVMPNETTFTIPAHQVSYRLPRSRLSVMVQVPEQTVTIPGVEQLSSQFGFILAPNGGDNYTASVKLLSDDQMSQISDSSGGSMAMFLNASEVATKNVWHKAVTKVSGDEVAFEVYDENGTRLDSMAKTIGDQGSGELGILVTYPTGQVLAFKNLKVEALGQSPAPQTSEGQVQGNGFEFLFPCVRISLLLAGAALAIVCLKGRKESKGNHSNALPESSQDL
jgi:hypothetical protein